MGSEQRLTERKGSNYMIKRPEGTLMMMMMMRINSIVGLIRRWKTTTMIWIKSIIGITRRRKTTIKSHYINWVNFMNREKGFYQTKLEPLNFTRKRRIKDLWRLNTR